MDGRTDVVAVRFRWPGGSRVGEDLEITVAAAGCLVQVVQCGGCSQSACL